MENQSNKENSKTEMFLSKLTPCLKEVSNNEITLLDIEKFEFKEQLLPKCRNGQLLQCQKNLFYISIRTTPHHIVDIYRITIGEKKIFLRKIAKVPFNLEKFDKENLILISGKISKHLAPKIKRPTPKRFRKRQGLTRSTKLFCATSEPIFETSDQDAFLLEPLKKNADIDHISYLYGTNRKKIDNNQIQKKFRKRQGLTRSKKAFHATLEPIFGRSDQDVSHFKLLSRKITDTDYISYPILYGTNRKQIDNNRTKVSFGNDRSKNLNLGMCHVNIPKRHKLCKIERPSWFEEWLLGETPNKHFTILNNKIIDEMTFINALKDKFAESKQNDVLLFIHGYNVKFNDAMYRTAQLGYDLNFKGAVTAFSWVSCGTTLEYITDLDNAEYSVSFLSNYIKTLINCQETSKLHIIAHSMGNVVLCKALKILKEEGIYPCDIIDQIILAAPDIDIDIFNQIWEKIHNTKNITLYASDKDKALKISKKIRSDKQRLGDVGNNIFLIDGVDSIDASEVDTNFLGHGYFAETQSLLSDIYGTLSGKSPQNRMLLLPKPDENCPKYWKLKKL